MHYKFQCGTCGKDFPAGWRARDNHCYSTGHNPPEFECDTCPLWFSSRNAVNQHMADKNHFQWPCGLCDETFPSEAQCRSHEEDDHLYCNDCNVSFRNHNDLNMHKRSGVHLGRHIKCPFCEKGYATATGVTHHLESGSCSRMPDLDKNTLYRLVRSRDPQGVISKQLLEWPDSGGQYEATDQAYNGYGWECYLCHRTFGSCQSLNQHLNSPTHQQHLYHCPKADCRVEFKTLAAFINHLESESCGLMRFKAVQDTASKMLAGGRLIGY